VGFKRDAIVCPVTLLRLAQLTNGAGPGSGSKNNSYRLLAQFFKRRIGNGLLFHMDQFFGGREIVLETGRYGAGVVALLSPSTAMRDSDFRADTPESQALRSGRVSVADAQSHLGQVSSMDGAALTAAIRQYGAKRATHELEGRRTQLRGLAEATIDGHTNLSTLHQFAQSAPAGLVDADKRERLSKKIVRATTLFMPQCP
jgi:hypothetical protein